MLHETPDGRRGVEMTTGASDAAQGGEQKETGRVEAFSDGVFAIAVTLLILNVSASQAFSGHGGLLAGVLRQWSALLAYVVSFVTILIMWINHHRIFTHIARTNQRFLILNGLLLLFITFVNYPTALMALAFGDSKWQDQRDAALIYSATLVVIALLYNTLWRYAAADGRLLWSNADGVEVAAITRQYRFGPLFYLAAFVVAFVSAPASFAVDGLLAVYFAVIGQLSEKA